MYSYPQSSYTSPQPSSATKPLFTYPHTTSHSHARRMPALNPEPLSLSSYLDDPDHPFYHSHTSGHSHHTHHGMQSVGVGWGDRTPPSVCSSEGTIASMHTAPPVNGGSIARKGGGSGDSPSDFLFDRPRSPDPISDIGHRDDMAAVASMEEQRAMLIMIGGGNAGAGGMAGVLSCSSSGLGSVATSPQLSPASVCTGASEHHMALSPLSAQSSQSSTNSLSYTTCGSTMSQQLLPPALPIAPPPPLPRTPQSTRKRKSPPAVKEGQRSLHGSGPHIHHNPHTQQQQQHGSNVTPDKLRGNMPAFTPSPLGVSVHSTPSPLLIDTQGGSLAPPPTVAAMSGRDEFWLSLAMLQPQQPLSMSSSCASSPLSAHSSPAHASHHQFFHPQTRIHSTPPLVLSSPSTQQSFLPSPLHGVSPLHSLHIYSPTHGQSSLPTPSAGNPPAPLFAPGSTSSSAASSAGASPPSGLSSVAVAATPSSSLSFVSPHFTCPLPVVSVSLDCSLLEATPAFFSLFHIPSPSHLAHLSLFSLLHAGSCMRVLSALLGLAEGECEREALSVKGCKLSADAIIRTGMRSMNPQQQQQQMQQQAQQLRTVAPVSASQSHGITRGVVAAVIGGGNRSATAFSFEPRSGPSGSVEKGGVAMAATNTSSILLHLAVDSCAFALHSMMETQRRTPTASSPPLSHTAGMVGDMSGGGGEFELTSAWLGGVFPVSALCFDCQLLIAPVVDAAGSMHRFMVVVSEVKRRTTAATVEEEAEESERDERLRDMVEERVRRWRDGNGGKKRRKRAKVDRTTKKLSATAAIKRETSNGSSSSGSQPARKAAKTGEGKRKMEE